MRVTVIPGDRWIRRDDESANLDSWPFDDSNIHAIQWYDNEGEVEFKGRPKLPNEVFTDEDRLEPYLLALTQYLDQQALSDAAKDPTIDNA